MQLNSSFQAAIFNSRRLRPPASAGQSASAIDYMRDWTANLFQPTYYNGTYPFINLFRSGVATWDVPTSGSCTIDPTTGNLSAISAGCVIARRIVFSLQNSVGAYFISGNYVCDAAQSGMYCTLVGTSGLSSIVNGSSAASPEATFSVSAATASFSLTVTYTNGTGSTIASMGVPYIGLVSSRTAYNAGEIFDPGMVSDLTGIRAIKFSDWNGQNSITNDVVSYSQLVSESYNNWSVAGYTESGKVAHVPYSVSAKLAKKLNCINWFSLPVCYDLLYYTYASGSPGVFTAIDNSNSWRTCTLTAASPCVVTTTQSHGWFAGQPVEFPVGSGTLPTGVSAGTVYFVSATGLTGSTFQISATVGGSSVNSSGSAGSSTVNPVRAHGWSDNQSIGFWDYNIRPTTATITIASPAVFTVSGHGLSAGKQVWFSTTGALPTGLTATTPYYVIATGLTSSAFQVSTSVGGAAVNTSGTQSGTHSLQKGPVGIIWSTGYFARVIDPYHFSVATTSGGTGLQQFSNVIVGLGGYNVSARYDPKPMWISILTETKNANPNGFILPMPGLEVWNFNYYYNVAQGLWSGMAGVPGDAGAGYAWMLMSLWAAVETVYPRSQYIRSTDNQAVNFNQLATAYTYSDPANILFPGQTLTQLLQDGGSSAISGAPYATPELNFSGVATMTIASPCVVTVPAGTTLYNNQSFQFSTTGALPTGVATATTYYVIGSSISGATFQFSATSVSGVPGAAVNTSGTQSGTHTWTAIKINAGVVTLIANGYISASNATWQAVLTTANTTIASAASQFLIAANAAAPGVPLISYEGGHEGLFGSGVQTNGNPGAANPTMTIASPCVITADPTFLVIANESVAFTTTGALPTGLTSGTAYYIVGSSISTNTFSVSATQGGSAINTSGSQSGAHTITSNTTDVALLAAAYHAWFGTTEAGTWAADHRDRVLIANGYRNWNQYVWAGKWDTAGTAYGAKADYNIADTPLTTAIKGLAIVVPTILSANVANTTPSHIDLTINETVLLPLPATSAFAYTGSTGGAKSVTAVTTTDNTHFYLTMSPTFANGDTGTLAYTQPGSNKLQDLLGVLAPTQSGITVSNNVRAAARTDTFVRADSASTLNNPSDGLTPLWVPETGTWGIASNRAYCTNTSGDNKILLDTGNFNDDVTFGYIHTGHFGGCIVRYASAGNFLLFNATDSTTKAIQFYQCVGGTYTLMSTSANNVVNDLAANTLRVVYTGSAITVYSNGTLVLTLTNSNFLSATKIGLRSPSASSSNDPRWTSVTTS